jgi:hypothetical protein
VSELPLILQPSAMAGYLQVTVGLVEAGAKCVMPPLKSAPCELFGIRTFDPDKVGYVINASGFPKYEVVDKRNNLVIGHSNASHKSGAGLNDDQRR